MDLFFGCLRNKNKHFNFHILFLYHSLQNKFHYLRLITRIFHYRFPTARDHHWGFLHHIFLSNVYICVCLFVCTIFPIAFLLAPFFSSLTPFAVLNKTTHNLINLILCMHAVCLSLISLAISLCSCACVRFFYR